MGWLSSPGLPITLFMGWVVLTYLNCKDGIWSSIVWFVFSIIIAIFVGIAIRGNKSEDSLGRRASETEDEKLMQEFLLFKRHKRR